MQVKSTIDRLVGGHARTRKCGGPLEAESLRHRGDRVRCCDGELGIPAVPTEIPVIGHLVSGNETADVLAHFFDDPGHIQAEDVRPRPRRVAGLGDAIVDGVQTTRFDVDDDFPGAGVRGLRLAEPEGLGRTGGIEQ